MKYRHTFILASLAALILTTPTHTNAQSAGITVTPPLLSINLAEDQEFFQTTINYSNHFDQDVELKIDIRDFGALEDGGGLFFYGTDNQSTQWQQQHALAPWLEVQPQKITIPANQQQVVTLTIHNRPDLSPGGHYAAVVATLSSDTVGNIAINQSLSTLLFANKLGGHLYDLKVDQLKPQTAWWGQVQGASIQVQNTGNTHLVPRGKLELKDPAGRSLGQATINQASTILLPGASQSFDSSFIDRKITWLPGNHTLVLSYRYDGHDQVSQTTTTVFAIGWLIPSLALLTIIGLTGYLWRRKQMRTFID